MVDFGVFYFPTDFQMNGVWEPDDRTSGPAAMSAIEVAVAAEERGFESLFFPEHTHIRHHNVYYGGGYSGHGLGMASYAGTILADLMLDRDLGPARPLVDRFRIPVPPEPLRWIAGQALFKTLELMDRRLDGRVRRKYADVGLHA
jgi:hypothetical protein